MSSPFHEGLMLPDLVRQVSQPNINKYAEASGDYNPIHIDQEFAASTPLGGTIAHGMLVLAYISEMLSNTFGEHWDSNGNLSIRFRSPARPGDTLTVSSKVESVSRDDDIVCVTCSLSCRNQADEVVVSGEARVRIPECR
ncbi:MAG: MaoC family dehydratase [Dehalococcoidia bacterium]|nr:MaoC family dehydratase [Dehalococcoidia bacterium]